MIHEADQSMTIVIGRHCPYCVRGFAVGDLIVEDDHPVRHLGCGPTVWPGDDDDLEDWDR